jgi:hypothetical protein
MIGPLCLHCQSRPASRPRGLCYRCYYQSGDRLLYRRSGNSVPGTPEHTATLSTCSRCGNLTGRQLYEHVRRDRTVCTTCRRPEPFRTLYHARLAEFERRIAAGLRLFEDTAA